MANEPSIVGIDVSEKTFNAHCDVSDVQFPNHAKGFRELVKLAPLKSSVYAMEATGTYHYKLALYLYKKGFNVMVLNPYKVKHWIMSESDLANDDKHAAMNVASYAALRVSKGVSFWQPLPPKLAKARVMVSLLNRFTKITTCCSNMNHAMGFFLGKNDELLKVMPVIGSSAEEMETPIERALCNLVKEIYPEQFKLLQSVPGIGAKTASVFCVLCKGFENFSSCKQLTSFVGLAPRFHESGTSIRSKRKISKTGNPYLRGLLFMCAWSAINYNKPCNDLYRRLLSRGKNKMSAQVAVMHKLVKISYGVVKSGEAYRGGKELIAG
jgi:transposase